MSAAAMPFKSRVERFLVERHGLGFSARGEACTLRSFARHLHEIGHCGPLTVEVMTDWARRDSHGSTDPVTWARRLKKLRTFVRWLQQFEPDTEVPDDTIFGRMPERKAPHIYSEQEIIDLLASARRLGPASSLRGIVFETLFASDCLDRPADRRSAVAEERRRRSQDGHAEHPPDLSQQMMSRQLSIRRVFHVTAAPMTGTRNSELSVMSRQTHKLMRIKCAAGERSTMASVGSDGRRGLIPTKKLRP